MNQTHVFLSVQAFGPDPSVVTALLGPPSSVFVRGDPIPGPREGTRAFERWERKSPLPLTESFEAHVAALLPWLEAHAPALKKAAQRYQVELRCAAYYREHFNVGLTLSPQVTARLGALRLGMDFDLYFLGAGDEEVFPGLESEPDAG